MTRYFKELGEAKEQEGKFVCIGLDPQFNSVDDFPSGVRGETIADKLVSFLVPIIESTADIAAWYKPNLSFYVQHGWEGLLALETVYAELDRLAPDCLRVHDGKHGDIGSTNDGYVRLAFERLGADAVTLHNYMGMAAMEPFLKQGNKGSFVLVRTSNEGADEFQKQALRPWDIPLYEYVAQRIVDHWNGRGNCGAVAGASPTSIGELAHVRQTLGDGVPILCPGVGKQGGSAAEAYGLGSDSQGLSIGINSSGGITHAHKLEEHKGKHWVDAARAEALKLHGEITTARAA